VAATQKLPPFTVYEPRNFAPQIPVIGASGTPITLTLDTSDITDGDHGFQTGDFVRVEDVTGNTAANGLRYVVRISATQVQLVGTVSSGPFWGGGWVSLARDGLDFIRSAYCNDAFFDDLMFEIESRREATAYLRLESDSIPSEPDDLRMFYADDYLPPKGPSYFDDPVYGYPDIQNHPVLLAGLLSIAEEVNRKRAAGVQVDEYLAGPKDVIGQGETDSAFPISVWTIYPGAGKVWLYYDGFFGHNPGGGLWMHTILFSYDDGTSGWSPYYAGLDSERITRARLQDFGGGPQKRIAAITGFVLSDGSTPVRLVGVVRVLEVSP
jgi:hypothetical protein